MIGVVSKEGEEEIVKEFFELFKVPWEFYNENRKYPVVLSTQDSLNGLDAKLVFLYSSEKLRFDIENKINVTPLQENKALLKYKELQLPVYGKISFFGFSSDTETKLNKTTGEAIGIEIKNDDRRIIRIGFDLFQEVYFLLTSGQPIEFSHIPSLDLHISILRELILEYGIPLVEIPPVPAGYDYVCCLTHDIDFAGIKCHKFDHTFFGFIYRATLGSCIDLLRGRSSLKKLLKNLKAVLLLPAVYLGIARDFWNQLDDYNKIEKEAPSTFFLIPFKNESGKGFNGNTEQWRATRYDILDIKKEVQKLRSMGCEIGLHGIDAWVDSEKGRQELQRISQITGDNEIGVRMHWLYFNHESPRILEEAGFYYDSTLGYNDAVGYRNGTTQAFKPIGVEKLLELPLNVQDTALFYPGRMALSEGEASSLIDRLIENSTIFGGVLTINWHDRSLAPERLWGDFYIELLKKMRKRKVWFGTAKEIVRWFNKRRASSFGEIRYTSNTVKLAVKSENTNTPLEFVLRVHLPKEKSHEKIATEYERSYIDLSFSSKLETEISFT